MSDIQDPAALARLWDRILDPDVGLSLETHRYFFRSYQVGHKLYKSKKNVSNYPSSFSSIWSKGRILISLISTTSSKSCLARVKIIYLLKLIQNMFSFQNSFQGSKLVDSLISQVVA